MSRLQKKNTCLGIGSLRIGWIEIKTSERSQPPAGARACRASREDERTIKFVCILWNEKHQWGVKISKTDYALSKGLIFPLWQYDKCEENENREIEVIGNIFDNPELLNEEDEEWDG